MEKITLDSSRAEVLEAAKKVKEFFFAQELPNCSTGIYDNGRFAGAILMQDAGAFFDCKAVINEAERLGFNWQIRKENEFYEYGEGFTLEGCKIFEGDIVLDIYHSYKKES